MNEITTIGVDLAKTVFQLHGVDAEGTAVLRRQLRRSQMLEFFSACPAGAWSAWRPVPVRITGRGN